MSDGRVKENSSSFFSYMLFETNIEAKEILRNRPSVVRIQMAIGGDDSRNVS